MTSAEIDAALAADPAFADVCDEHRDAWIAALDADTATQWAAVVRCGDVLDADADAEVWS